MKALRTLALLLTMAVSVCTLAVMFPQLTAAIPKAKSFVETARSKVGLASPRQSTPNVTVAAIAPNATLTPAQVRFLEFHRRRHELLRAALVQ